MAEVMVKNTYKKEHDRVIMEALKESPTNRNEAFRIAQKRLKEEFNFNANPNQISSRFYTYIKPKILDKRKENEGKLKNKLTGPAGTDILQPSRSKQYMIVKGLAQRLSPDDQIQLANELLFEQFESE